MDYNFRGELCGMVDKILEINKKMEEIPFPASCASIVDSFCFEVKKQIVEDTIKELKKDYVMVRKTSKEAEEYPVTAAEYGDME